MKAGRMWSLWWSVVWVDVGVCICGSQTFSLSLMPVSLSGPLPLGSPASQCSCLSLFSVRREAVKEEKEGEGGWKEMCGAVRKMKKNTCICLCLEEEERRKGYGLAWKWTLAWKISIYVLFQAAAWPTILYENLETNEEEKRRRKWRMLFMYMSLGELLPQAEGMAWHELPLSTGFSVEGWPQ